MIDIFAIFLSSSVSGSICFSFRMHKCKGFTHRIPSQVVLLNTPLCKVSSSLLLKDLQTNNNIALTVKIYLFHAVSYMDRTPCYCSGKPAGDGYICVC